MIVACDKNRGIGRDNDLPWNLPGDMKYFRKVTSTTSTDGLQNAVIMGRRTWESIPPEHRPLSKRLNVVLTRNTEYHAEEGVLLADSLENALTMLESYDVGEVFIIGGGSLYEYAISQSNCQKLYITEIQNSFDCDTFFPEIPEHFEEVSRSEPVEENGAVYEFVVYERLEH